MNMKRFALMTVFVLSATAVVDVSCNKDKEHFVGIENISFENYPKVDGSTSARALNQMIAFKLLDVRYEWVEPIPSLAIYEWKLFSNEQDVPKEYRDFFWQHIKTSQTHGAFMNLIDGEADIILTHRTISPDEKAYADNAGVTFIEPSIALDAFIFIVNKNNPVKSLTVEQIQNIYTGKITNWSQVGGNNTNIQVFTRPRNSGSEEVFRELVMDGLEPLDFPESAIGDMTRLFYEVMEEEDGICYIFNNYKDWIVRIPDNIVPKIAINGIFPNENTVKNRTYPFIAEVHVAIRSDLDRHSMAYKLYEWLQSENAISTIKECGFIPK